MNTFQAHKYTKIINYRNHLPNKAAVQVILQCIKLGKLCLELEPRSTENISKFDLCKMFSGLQNLCFLQIIRFLHFGDDCLEIVSQNCKQVAILDVN